SNTVRERGAAPFAAPGAGAGPGAGAPPCRGSKGASPRRIALGSTLGGLPALGGAWRPGPASLPAIGTRVVSTALSVATPVGVTLASTRGSGGGVWGALATACSPGGRPWYVYPQALWSKRSLTPTLNGVVPVGPCGVQNIPLNGYVAHSGSALFARP